MDQSPDGARESAAVREAKRYLPDELANYFAETERKHFDPETAVGSSFTETHSLRDLLVTAIEQRGQLRGDDREELIALGASPEAFVPGRRYLKVETPGLMGVVRAAELDPWTLVTVVRTKGSGLPCDLAVEGVPRNPVGYGTIIIAPNEKQSDDSPEPSTEETVITAFPGPPTSPFTEDYWPEGTVVAVEDVLGHPGLGPDTYLVVRGGLPASE